jgi:hypothetical protein
MWSLYGTTGLYLFVGIRKFVNLQQFTLDRLNLLVDFLGSR